MAKICMKVGNEVHYRPMLALSYFAFIVGAIPLNVSLRALPMQHS